LTVATPGVLGIQGVTSGAPVNVAGTGQTSVGSSLSVVLATAHPAVVAWGHGAPGSSPPSGAMATGLRAANQLPAARGDNQVVNPMADLMGRNINVPLAPRASGADQQTNM